MTGRATRLLAVLSLVILTIGCDRVTKGIAARTLAGRPRLSLASDCVRLEYVENRGGFLSLGAGLSPAVRTGVFSVGTFVILGVLGVWASRELMGGQWVVGPALLWAGGVANLVDRLARGTVVDFLNVGVGTVRTGIFNVADLAITLGAALVIGELATSPRRGLPWGSARRRTTRCS